MALLDRVFSTLEQGIGAAERVFLEQVQTQAQQPTTSNPSNQSSAPTASQLSGLMQTQNALYFVGASIALLAGLASAKAFKLI